MPHIILRLPTVIERTGLSRSTLYLLISRAEFPGQVQLGTRSVGWVESEVQAWLESRIAKGRKVRP